MSVFYNTTLHFVPVIIKKKKEKYVNLKIIIFFEEIYVLYRDGILSLICSPHIHNHLFHIFHKPPRILINNPIIHFSYNTNSLIPVELNPFPSHSQNIFSQYSLWFFQLKINSQTISWHSFRNRILSNTSVV